MFPALTNDDKPRPVAPPLRFRELQGSPRGVNLGMQSRWTPNHERLTPAQRAGIRYEDKIQQRLVKWSPTYEPSPHVHFEDDSGYRTVVPDGVASFPDRLFIFEIKVQHMPEAWWQLERLYRPVLQVWRPMVPVTCVEICHSYDPAMPFPAPYEKISSIDLLRSSESPLVVLPWRQ